MVVKFQQNQDRGSAGQSATTPKRGFNFANMYNMNRADDQVNNQVSEMSAQAINIKNTFQSENTRSINNGKTTDGSKSVMADAVGQAKGLANKAQNFDPGVQARKSGQSAYQSGITSFYAGGQGNPAVQKARKFGNIYTQSLGRQADIAGRYNNDAPGERWGAKLHPDTRTSAYSSAQNEQQAVNTRELDRNKAHPRDNQINSMNTLDWGVKTGRITQEQSNRAQNDPEYYQQLMKEIQ